MLQVTPARSRERIAVEGIVQGVGFRPFVYRLAGRYALSGWVQNTGGGVLLEVEGEGRCVTAFRTALLAEAPPLSAIQTVRVETMPLVGDTSFRIVESEKSSAGGEISPDCDVCDDCLAELFDPANRRYAYPFINCTNCGPRYSIISATPYDRPATTMASFAMCPSCLREYHDPADRRFHAQPNACPACGPRLRLLQEDAAEVPGDPLANAIAALNGGAIVAIKGLGGYHLAVDARNAAAVARLRLRKHREEKPFALMCRDLAAVRTIAQCGEKEARLLTGVERPVVLLKKLPEPPVAEPVAPGNGWFGVMLPGTPLHHLLLAGVDSPLVMTSGNISDAPIVYRDAAALRELAGIADLFLTHDREIRTRSDDSVLRLFRDEPLFIRRSRGFVPRGITIAAPQESVLALGAELKGAICFTRGSRAFMSQHLGDLKDAPTQEFLEETVRHLGAVLEITPQLVAHDLHPDYLSTRYAETLSLPRVGVQHHHAHMASCMAENRLEGPVIGVVFDGTGYGSDGSIWGGEFLLGSYGGFERRGHLAQLRMPGGDAAVREPYRMALAALHVVYGDALFEQPLPFLTAILPSERLLFLKMLERGINSPLTSSCGRLFDAVAALIGVRNRVSYEGQAAIELEALAERADGALPYSWAIHSGACHLLDLAPAVAEICCALKAGVAPPEVARAFHLTMARAAVEVCLKIREESGVSRVVLSGGVFQNRLLTEDLVSLLMQQRFETFCHRLVPPNDGGIALGQAVIAASVLARRS